MTERGIGLEDVNNKAYCSAVMKISNVGFSGSCSQINAVSQDVNDCSKYFVCINYQLQSRTCPSGQLFDPSRLSCGYTQNPSGCRMPTFQSRQGTCRYFVLFYCFLLSYNNVKLFQNSNDANSIEMTGASLTNSPVITTAM